MLSLHERWLDYVVLHGKNLGQAIEQAIQLKIDSKKIKSKADVARAFQVSAQAIQGWIKTGAIAKEKIPLLWQYFGDVVGPEHWGLSPSDTSFIKSASQVNKNEQTNKDFWPFAVTKYEDIVNLSPQQLQQLDLMIAAYLLGAQSNSSKSSNIDSTAA